MTRPVGRRMDGHGTVAAAHGLGVLGSSGMVVVRGGFWGGGVGASREHLCDRRDKAISIDRSALGLRGRSLSGIG